jgi:hypothetical protein
VPDEVFPELIEGYRPCPGEIVSMRVPESPVFDGLDPLDLAWFELGAVSSHVRVMAHMPFRATAKT